MTFTNAGIHYSSLGLGRSLFDTTPYLVLWSAIDTPSFSSCLHGLSSYRQVFNRTVGSKHVDADSPPRHLFSLTTKSWRRLGVPRLLSCFRLLLSTPSCDSYSCSLRSPPLRNRQILPRFVHDRLTAGNVYYFAGSLFCVRADTLAYDHLTLRCSLRTSVDSLHV